MARANKMVLLASLSFAGMTICRISGVIQSLLYNIMITMKEQKLGGGFR
jgi:hypothetical protein